MYEFKVPTGAARTMRARDGQGSNLSSRSSSSMQTRAPLDDVASTPQHPAAQKAPPAQALAAVRQRDVRLDMQAWKEAMHAERQQRLQHSAALAEAAHRKQAAAAATSRQPAAARRDHSADKRTPARQAPVELSADDLTVEQYHRSLVAASRVATDVLSNTPTGSRSSSAVPLAQASTRSHHGSSKHPTSSVYRQLPNKAIDPLDVHLVPARSVVRQYIQEPTPFFLRRNKYGELDGYVDQAAVSSYQLRNASERKRTSNSAAWSESPLRDTKPPPAVWRREPSPSYCDYGTPRSVVLRSSHIAATVQQRQQEDSPFASRALSETGRLHRQPVVSRRRHLHSLAGVNLSSSERRLVGPPTPAQQFLSYGTAVDRSAVISPHFRGNVDLPSRAAPASRFEASARLQYASEEELDPVPVSFAAPSPVQRHDSSRESWQSLSHIPKPESGASTSQWQNLRDARARGSANEVPTEREGPSSPSYRESTNPPANHPEYASPTRTPQSAAVRNGLKDSGQRASPSGVEVSPPTPTPSHSAPLSPEYHAAPSGRVQPTNRLKTPMQNLLQQLSLPAMRSGRADLFQGHQPQAVPQGVEASPSAGHTATPLRHSTVHDQLEQHLLMRKQQDFAQQRAAGAAHVDPHGNHHGSGGPLPASLRSTTQMLLQKLASKPPPQ